MYTLKGRTEVEIGLLLPRILEDMGSDLRHGSVRWLYALIVTFLPQFMEK
jgi:hypothetical protein